MALAERSGKSIAAVARDLGVSPETLRVWVQQARVDASRGPAGTLTTAEQAELQRVRREVRSLQQEREILKKAAAFVASETW